MPVAFLLLLNMYSTKYCMRKQISILFIIVATFTLLSSALGDATLSVVIKSLILTFCSAFVISAISKYLTMNAFLVCSAIALNVFSGLNYFPLIFSSLNIQAAGTVERYGYAGLINNTQQLSMYSSIAITSAAAILFISQNRKSLILLLISIGINIPLIVASKGRTGIYIIASTFIAYGLIGLVRKMAFVFSGIKSKVRLVKISRKALVPFVLIIVGVIIGIIYYDSLMMKATFQLWSEKGTQAGLTWLTRYSRMHT